LRSAVQRASFSGERFFADASVYVERYVEGARHVEVQVLATTAGRSTSTSGSARSSGAIRRSSRRRRPGCGPADTRTTIIRGLEIGETKKVERPWRKHGVLPV
jgi:Carbamoyl-phosphate synthase L chain, ATP binding domain